MDQPMSRLSYSLEKFTYLLACLCHLWTFSSLVLFRYTASSEQTPDDNIYFLNVQIFRFVGLPRILRGLFELHPSQPTLGPQRAAHQSSASSAGRWERQIGPAGLDVNGWIPQLPQNQWRIHMKTNIQKRFWSKQTISFYII